MEIDTRTRGTAAIKAGSITRRMASVFPGQPENLPRKCRLTVSALNSTTKSSPWSARTSGSTTVSITRLRASALIIQPKVPWSLTTLRGLLYLLDPRWGALWPSIVPHSFDGSPVPVSSQLLSARPTSRLELVSARGSNAAPAHLTSATIPQFYTSRVARGKLGWAAPVQAYSKAAFLAQRRTRKSRGRELKDYSRGFKLLPSLT